MDLEKECDDSLIIAVTQNIDDYIKVGHGLTLSTKTLEIISQDNNNDIHRKNAVLWAWKIKKNGNNATYIELLKIDRPICHRIHFEIYLNENYIKANCHNNSPVTRDGKRPISQLGRFNRYSDGSREK